MLGVLRAHGVVRAYTVFQTDAPNLKSLYLCNWVHVF